jgi:hypothetical protein
MIYTSSSFLLKSVCVKQIICLLTKIPDMEQMKIMHNKLNGNFKNNTEIILRIISIKIIIKDIIIFLFFHHLKILLIYYSSINEFILITNVESVFFLKL